MNATDEQLLALDKGYFQAVAALNAGTALLRPDEIIHVCEALVFAKDLNVRLRLENRRLRSALRMYAAAAQLAAEQEGP